MNDAAKHCFDSVRANDKDRFLTSLFAPEDKRPHLLALYAFDIEIGRIPNLISEPAVGEIRYQWWLDALDAIYNGDAQDHPLAQALALAIEAGDLPKQTLKNLVTARIFDLYADPMPSLIDLEGYLGETNSAVIQLASLILVGEGALASAEVAGLAGVAYGLANILRGTKIQRRRGKCFIPSDMLARHGATAADVISGNNETAVNLALAELRDKARARLKEARNLAWTIKPTAMPAFLHVALTENYLNGLAKGKVEMMQLHKQWLLWKAAKAEAF